MRQEELEQVELLQGQIDELISNPDLVASDVEADIADLQDIGRSTRSGWTLSNW